MTELTDEELLRYARQVLLTDWDMEAQLRLKAARVVIIGAGGLGCPAAETLARAGVGHITIIDNDVIEASNLQRQTLFVAADIGESKAERAAERLTEINPYIEAIGIQARLSDDNAATWLKSEAGLPDLLLDCTDNFATRDTINRISVALNIPLLSASAIGMTGQLSLFESAEGTGCYHCLFGAASDGDEDTRNCANSGVLASTTTVMGNLQANTALQYLGRGHNPLSGKLLLWDARTMQQRMMNYKADPTCPICAKPPPAQQ